MTKTILNSIKSYKLAEVASRKLKRPLSELETSALDAEPVRGFANRIIEASETGFALIAEIKKASPSKGLIRADFHPPTLAAEYEKGGATCISVLTDTPSFQGQDLFLTEARAATSIPLLRKDFMYDTYQVAESRALGADCILIIMASVSDMQAQELESAALQWNMDVLIEIHNKNELERGLRLRSPLMGINNRNLQTFDVNLDITRELAQYVPKDKIIVSESGIYGPKDLTELSSYGTKAFLVGESLMRQADVAGATKRLLAQQSNTSEL
jgi:indole-3-glycerol phosphate synthase